MANCKICNGGVDSGFVVHSECWDKIAELIKARDEGNKLICPKLQERKCVMENKEQIYDEQIYPLMGKIIEICKEHEIPFAAQFVYARDEDEDVDFLCTSCLSFENKQIKTVHGAMTQNGCPIASITVTKSGG